MPTTRQSGASLADARRCYLLASASEATPLEWELTPRQCPDQFRVNASITMQMEELDQEEASITMQMEELDREKA